MAHWLLSKFPRMAKPMAEESPRTGRSGERGFTLIELMITVAIIAVLAVLAGVGYARWIRTSKTGEATAMIGSIKGAEETYRAETFKYLDASACAGTCTSLAFGVGTFYPPVTPSDQKAAWTSGSYSGATTTAFQRLNVSADTSVYYRYAVGAGTADGTAHTIDGRTYPLANDPWYVVKAVGDLNNNGVQSSYWSSSWDSTIWSLNSDE